MKLNRESIPRKNKPETIIINKKIQIKGMVGSKLLVLYHQHCTYYIDNGFYSFFLFCFVMPLVFIITAFKLFINIVL